MQTLVPQQLRPKEITIGKVKSLSVQGCYAWTTGFRRRPNFPFQHEVFDILQEYFKSDSKTLQGLPGLCFPTEYQLWQQDEQSTSNWKKRYMTACSKAKIVAKSRSTNWGRVWFHLSIFESPKTGWFTRSMDQWGLLLSIAGGGP